MFCDGLTHAETVKSCSPLTMPSGRATYSPSPDSLTALPILPGTRAPVAPELAMEAMVRVSAAGPVPIWTCWPGARPVVLLTLTVLSPALGGGRQPRAGLAEQVVVVTRELRPGRDGHRREDGLPGRVLGQGPVRQVGGAVAGVVELDERVGRVGTGARAELVDLDRADVPHLLGGGRALPRAVRRVRPRGVADQVAAERRRSRGDRERGAHARARRDRSEGLRPVRGARDDGSPLPGGHGNAQLHAHRGRCSVVLVYVTVDSWLEPGANVCSPGGVAVAEAGVRLSACTSYLAATMLACTAWSVASVG